MNFQLTKEQEFVRKMVREFATNEVEPLAADIDKEHRFPVETVEKMAKYGMLGVPFPTEYGGAGGDHISYAITVEELSRVCASTGVICSAHTSLCCWPIFNWGNEEQKKKYLPDLLSGKKLGAFGLTEPNAGTDASGQQTRAELVGDKWIINGAKVFITNGGYADVFVVMAMTDKSKGNHGISAFIVPKDAEGLTIGKFEDKMGMRGSATCELSFDNIHLPADALLGSQGMGFKMAMQALDGARISIGAIAAGLAEHAMTIAKNYANERVAFGKPIGKFEGVQFKFADMSAEIRAMELMTYDTARMKAEGKRHTLEAAQTKLFSATRCTQICLECQQVLGGNGYSKEYHVERFVRDAKLLEIGEGTNEILRMLIGGTILAQK